MRTGPGKTPSNQGGECPYMLKKGEMASFKRALNAALKRRGITEKHEFNGPRKVI